FQRWMAALRQVVLPASGVRRQALGVSEELAGPGLTPDAQGLTPPRMVILIDGIDTVRSLSFSRDQLLAGIRGCYNRRTDDPEFERLTFCLLGVATPYNLSQDTRITPFNIGRRIELTDFTEPEAAPLRAGLVLGSSEMSGRAEAQARALLQRVLYWT